MGVSRWAYQFVFPPAARERLVPSHPGGDRALSVFLTSSSQVGVGWYLIVV